MFFPFQTTWWYPRKLILLNIVVCIIYKKRKANFLGHIRLSELGKQTIWVKKVFYVDGSWVLAPCSFRTYQLRLTHYTNCILRIASGSELWFGITSDDRKCVPIPHVAKCDNGNKQSVLLLLFYIKTNFGNLCTSSFFQTMQGIKFFVWRPWDKTKNCKGL